MKTIGLRKLYQEAPTLGEAVLVVHSGEIIGTFTPTGNGNGMLSLEDLPTPAKVEKIQKVWKEASMDEPVKKAIEPDEVKQTPRGQLRKGLGEIPGDPTATAPEKHYPMGTFGAPKPAPKPGKGKS